MKLIVPKFMLAELQAQLPEVLPAAEFVTVNQQGKLSGDPQGAEILIFPWRLPADTQEQLVSLPTLSWIHSTSAGVDHAPLEQIAAQGSPFTTAGGIFDRPIAETVLAYILMIIKRMPEFINQQRIGSWKKHSLREAAGLTVGLVGSGHIGSEIARLCNALDMQVLATRRHPERDVPGITQLFPPSELERLLSRSDFVVIAAPLTEETRGLIGAAQFAQMRSSAWLINIARGEIVIEAELISALRSGQLAGAALDVFAEEPLPSESPLWELENVILTPHNSWSTQHLKAREVELFVTNLRHYLRGEPLENVVDMELGY